MKFAQHWTTAMSVGIAAYGMALVAHLCGGGFLGWVVALPGMFVGLHLVGIPLVLVCEIGERARIIPRRWRTGIHELLLVTTLLVVGLPFLPTTVSGLFTAFLMLKLLLRISFALGGSPVNRSSHDNAANSNRAQSCRPDWLGNAWDSRPILDRAGNHVRRSHVDSVCDPGSELRMVGAGGD